MSNLVEKIMNVDKAVRELYDEMIVMLNQDDMDYRIEFKGNTFDFNKPLNQNEKMAIDTQKHQITTMFLEDALEKLVHLLGSSEHDEDYELRYTWVNIANLQRSTDSVTTVSEIVSDEYEVDEGTSKDLNYDSIYIQAQRKDLSDDDKWNLLLNFITVQNQQKDTTGSDCQPELDKSGTNPDCITDPSDSGDGCTASQKNEEAA